MWRPAWERRRLRRPGTQRSRMAAAEWSSHRKTPMIVRSCWYHVRRQCRQRYARCCVRFSAQLQSSAAGANAAGDVAEPNIRLPRTAGGDAAAARLTAWVHDVYTLAMNESLPNVPVWMLHPHLARLPHHALPTGYHMRFYHHGDVHTWVRIQQAAEPFLVPTADTFARHAWRHHLSGAPHDVFGRSVGRGHWDDHGMADRSASGARHGADSLGGDHKGTGLRNRC
jgi:hypothetical protein